MFSLSLSLQKEVYMIAAGVIGGVFLICTVVMFLGVKERDGETPPVTLSFEAALATNFTH